MNENVRQKAKTPINKLFINLRTVPILTSTVKIILTIVGLNQFMIKLVK